MTQKERRIFLIDCLLKENPGYRDVRVPDDENEQKRLLRSLMNVRPPQDTSEKFLRIQDEYLREAIREGGITDLAQLKPVAACGNGELYLWQGDITRLEVDAIVNAANSSLLGCFIPHHQCIDNAIHSAAGVQLRLECHRLMQEQGSEELTNSAKMTKGYNLPARYVIHTVRPIIQAPRPTPVQEQELANCYRSCLKIAPYVVAVWR